MNIRNAHQRLYIIVSLILFSLAVTWIDAVVHPSYFTKIPIKILFFLALPLLYFAIWRAEAPAFRQLFRFEPRGLLISFLLGSAIYALITGGFFLTRSVFDYSAVTGNLTDGMGITSAQFPLVAVYISVFNSFLEEFFFRGFGFMALRRCAGPKLSWLLSPVLFAVYHVGMTAGAFQPILLGLMMTGLILGGLIFNALNRYFHSIYPSWFVHMAADAAIMTVGAVLFGLL